MSNSGRLMSVMVTVRIPKKLRDEAKAYGINISGLLRETLVEEIRKRKLEHINRLQDKARKILTKVGKNKIVEAVRETRNEN